MAQLTVYDYHPDRLYALSYDGTEDTVGSYQANPIFLKGPAGEDFVVGNTYWVHDKDPLTPDAKIYVYRVIYSLPKPDPLDAIRQTLVDLVTATDKKPVDGQGAPGKDGTVLYSGNTLPNLVSNTTGKKDDYYLYFPTGDVYQRQNSSSANAVPSTWILVGNFKGPKGDNSTVPGPKGDPSMVPGPKGEKGDPGTQTIQGIYTGGTVAAYALILILPASTNGTYDHVFAEIGLSQWGSDQKKTYYASYSNRSGFFSNVFCQGDNLGTGFVVAYQNTDGSVSMYIRVLQGYNEISFFAKKVQQATAATLLAFQSFIATTQNPTQEPDGLKVYDSQINQPDFEVGTTTHFRQLRHNPAPVNLLGATSDKETITVTVAELAALVSPYISTLTAPFVNPMPVFTPFVDYELVADTAAVYVIQRIIDGPSSLVEGTAKKFWLRERYSDGTEARYAGAETWSLVGDLTGIVSSFSAESVDKDVTLTLTNLPATRRVKIRVVTAENNTIETDLDLIDAVCTRPAGLATAVQLVYNFTDSNGSVLLFGSLADANNRMGRAFNEQNIGFAPGVAFHAECANLNVGTFVYYRWASDGATDCQGVGDQIFYVLDSTGGDSIKKAVRTTNNLITDVLPSTYSVPVITAAPAQQVTVFYQRYADTTNNYPAFRLWVNGPAGAYEVYNTSTADTSNHAVLNIPMSSPPSAPGFVNGYDYKLPGSAINIIREKATGRVVACIVEPFPGDNWLSTYPIDASPVAIPILTNVALQSVGGVATASSLSGGTPTATLSVTSINDGNTGPYNTTVHWFSATAALPEWAQITLSAPKSVRVAAFYTKPNDITAIYTDNLPSNNYGILDCQLQYQDGAGNWQTVQSVAGNTRARRYLTLPAPVTAQRWRLLVTNSSDRYAHLVELELYANDQLL